MASMRTPLRVGSATGRSNTTSASGVTRVRRTTTKTTTPKAKLNLQFATPRRTTTPTSSARKPLRVMTNTPNGTPTDVDIRKILQGVYAMVDVRLGADAEIDCSDAVAKKLADMGATILKKKGGRLTHVVVSHFTPQWKEKVSKWHSFSTPVEVVSQLWVNACFTNKQRMKESAFFPVNKGFETTSTTPGGSSTTNSALRVRTSMNSASARKKPARRASSVMGLFRSTGTLSLSGSPKASRNSLVTSTPTLPARSTAAGSRKRRALSMEPTERELMLRRLEDGTKKLLKKSSDLDISSAIVAVTQDTSLSTPVKVTPHELKTSTPPLTVRLKSLIERRKSFASSGSITTDLQQEQPPDLKAATANDCVSESCSEGEGEVVQNSSGDVTSGETSVPSSGNIASSSATTAEMQSPMLASLDNVSPIVPAKGDWACSICNCMNPRNRRLCKGCKASRVAAKTSVTDKTPMRRVLRSTSATPRQRTSTAKVAGHAAAFAATPTSLSSVGSSARKPPMATRKPTNPLKRPRFSNDTDNGSVRSSNDLFSDDRMVPSTPSKKQKTAQSSIKTPLTAMKVGPQRAIIGITGVDAETRGIIECAVHGIDANMSSEPGHRRARVVKSVDYAAGVTHLIVGSEIKRTIKVLFAIARGAWIVSEAWAFTSLEQEKWLKEEEYEVPAFPRRQLREHPEQRQVFRSLKFFVGSKIDPSREVLMSLIQCAGGEIVNQISVADYCICGDETLFRRANRTKIHGVTPKWVFDSIANLKLEDPLVYGLSSEESKDIGAEEQ